MRVAFYHNLPSGGAKRAFYELIKGTNEDIEYDLFSIDEDSNELFLDIRPLVRNVYRYKFSSRLGPKFLSPVMAPISSIALVGRLLMLHKKIAKDIDRGGYDVVLVASDHLTHTPYLLKFLRTRSLYYIHEPRRSSFEFNLSAINKIRQKPIIFRPAMFLKYYLVEARLKKQDILSVRRASKLLCNSLFSSESILRAYGRTAQVMYLGVDTDLFKPSEEKVGRDNYVLSVGSLHPNKCHALVIRSLAKINDNSRPRLIVACDRGLANEEGRLVSLARDMNVELEIHKATSEAQLRNLYSRALATVCVAELEPFGLTPLESMACGTPVLAINEGGYKETVKGEYGVLTDRSELQISQALKEIIKRKYSREKLRDYVIDNWSWRKSCEFFKSILINEARQNRD